jgi:hypothetical protein
MTDRGRSNREGKAKNRVENKSPLKLRFYERESFRPRGDLDVRGQWSCSGQRTIRWPFRVYSGMRHAAQVDCPNITRNFKAREE